MSDEMKNMYLVIKNDLENYQDDNVNNDYKDNLEKDFTLILPLAKQIGGDTYNNIGMAYADFQEASQCIDNSKEFKVNMNNALNNIPV